MHFPDLVLELILGNFPQHERHALRTVCAEWDAAVMTRFRTGFTPVMLSKPTDFSSFVKVFRESKQGIPFTRYILSLLEPTSEDFEIFTDFVGGSIIELSASAYGISTTIVWDPSWTQSPNAIIDINRKNHGGFFDRLARLLAKTTNLESLSILRFVSCFNAEPQSTQPQPVIPQLSKLRLLSMESNERTAVWKKSLICSAPLLQNARQIEGRGIVSLSENPSRVEPAIMNAVQMDSFLTMILRNKVNEEEWREKLTSMANRVLTLEVIFMPNMMPGDDTLCLPAKVFPRLRRLYYSYRTATNNPCAVQMESGQFPVLQYVHIHIGFSHSNRYPFTGCVLPTVETLVLQVSGSRHDENWEPQTIFPNLAKLIFCLIDLANDQVSRVIKSYKGTSSLRNLRMEFSEVGQKRFTTVDEIPDWGRFCGLNTTETEHSLLWPTTVEYGGVELSSFLPIIISSIRKGNLALESLIIRGYTRDSYGPHLFPNVEDCKAILEPMCKTFKLEVY